MNKQHTQIFFPFGIALLFIFLSNSLYFMMPYEHLNPYEFFQGTELNHFQILNIFIGGVAIPLTAIILGYFLSSLKEAGIQSIILTLTVILAIGVIQSILVFGYDILPGLMIVAVIGCLFLRADKWVTLVSFAVLMFLHLAVNGLGDMFLGGSGPEDTIYTNIQEVNAFSSVFLSTDYLAIVGTNLEIFWQSTLSNIYTVILSILPFILLGISFCQFNMAKFIKVNPGMVTFLIIMILGGGFTIKILQIVSLGSSSVFTIAEVIGGSLLSAGIYLIALAGSIYMPKRVTDVISNVGSRGLTVYIAFNIIMMFLSYGIGMGLYGEISIGIIFSIGLGLYVLMILAANIMKRFNIKIVEDLIIINRRK